MVTASVPQKKFTERFLVILKQSQFAWFIGQVTLLLYTTRYLARIILSRTFDSHLYHVALFGVVVAYVIVLYKTYAPNFSFKNLTNRQYISRLLLDDNVQYLMLASSWLRGPAITLALLPYAIYGSFHVATYTRQTLLPTLVPQMLDGSHPNSPAARLSALLHAYVRQKFQFAMELVAAIETLLLLRLIFGALILRVSFLQLLSYVMFLRLRYINSAYTRTSLHNFTSRVDTLVANPKTPAFLKSVWTTIKSLVSKFVNATGTQAAPRPANPTASAAH
ncbi:eukaryotic protein [Schizosaccharomyces japonicus yFS275]|uniref:Eukaryotic protein n=1 Tax=Schizosaccharomyces japonicus (strain yFS275 / FY16936) TaxID=402676 RepID=B6JY00_SCHJY|nr:eukaryotic protein [Schizosaccharomyces japonicus yFS275]EEB06418.1 eukaryotic protein [Schizosaccharomyces japonicus yFS275]